MTTGFDYTKLRITGITFESVVPHVTPKGQEVPRIQVGYKGKFIGMLNQYTKNAPHPQESILPGQWFAVFISENKEFDEVMNSLQPAGRELADLKRTVEYFAKRYLK